MSGRYGRKPGDGEYVDVSGAVRIVTERVDDQGKLVIVDRVDKTRFAVKVDDGDRVRWIIYRNDGSIDEAAERRKR